MGYVTESRPTRDIVTGFRWQEWDRDGRYAEDVLYSAGPSEFPFPFLQSGSQVTTSYRTGRRSLPDADEKLYQSYAENFAKYKAEYSSGAKTSFDSGHTFQSDITDFSYSHPAVTVYGHPDYFGWRYYRYTGLVGLKFPGFPSVGPEFDYSSSSVDGTTAINNTIPTMSKAGLATSLAELIREGVPALIGATTWKARSLVAKDAGGEYLNYQFGWKPLVNDIQKACRAVINVEKTLRQYERDSGRMVRRRFTFPTETVTAVTSGFGDVYFPSGCSSTLVGHTFSASQALPMLTTRTATREKWFSGAYSYYVPGRIKGLGDIPQAESWANHVLGLRITPEVLWNLAPWSWLLDWFANIGDVISNATHFGEDSLVIRYGYLMARTNVTETRTLSGASTYAGGNLGDLTLSTSRTRKERIRASPYGFGLNPDSFSVRQWAILAALGMTKTPGSLRTN